VQHWILFTTFVLLVLTGFPIKFADRAWAAWLIDEIGGLHRARLIHRWAGAIMLTGFAYHLIIYIPLYLWREKRRTGKGWLQVVLDLPMVMRWSDWKKMGHLLAYLLFIRRTRPDTGRFSLEEKFEYFGVFWGCMLLGMTGALMWANAWTSQHMTGRVLTTAALIHTFEAFLALLHVGVIHMIGVIFSPAVFPLSTAMLTGDTPPEELAEAHAAMLIEVDQQLKSGSTGEAHHD
jgi:cytochrome b subunit of formate dehydrogenase